MSITDLKDWQNEWRKLRPVDVSEEEVRRLRVLYDKGINMLASFISGVTSAQKQFHTDSDFAKWMVADVKIPVRLVLKATELLKDADKEREEQSLRAAKEADRKNKEAEKQAEKDRKEAERIRAEEERYSREKLELDRKSELLRQKEELAAREKKLETNAHKRINYDTNETDKAATQVRSARTKVAKTVSVEQAAEASLSELSKAIKARFKQKDSHEAAMKKYREQWVENAVALAVLVWTARQQFTADQEFGKWWDKEQFSGNSHDRAALVQMGRAGAPMLRGILEATDRVSFQLIALNAPELKQIPQG